MKTLATRQQLASVALLCTASLLTVLAFAGSEEGGRGFSFYGGVQGSANAAGLVTKLDTSLGYNFNRHFGMDVGIPFYFIRPSANTSSISGTGSTSGLGNVYSDLRLTVPNPAMNFGSVLTFTAPTGDKEKGLSTGRFTVDWTNHFDRRIYRITPFVNLGLANTVSDASFFLRPFASQGFVSHFEGGAEAGPVASVSLGASAYAIVPSGEQTVISRLIPNESAMMTAAQTAPSRGNTFGMGAQRNNSKRPFETISENVGGPELARDHGFSLWIVSRPSPWMALEVGYSRSIPYALNTFFFGTSFNVGSLASKLRDH